MIVGILVLFVILTITGLVTGLVIVAAKHKKSDKDSATKRQELEDVLNQFNVSEEQKSQLRGLYNKALEEIDSCEFELGKTSEDLTTSNGLVDTLTNDKTELNRTITRLDGEVKAKQRIIDTRDDTIEENEETIRREKAENERLSKAKTTCDPNTTTKTGVEGAYVCRGTVNCSAIQSELDRYKLEKTVCGENTEREGNVGSDGVANYQCKVSNSYKNEFNSMKNNTTECDLSTTNRVSNTTGTVKYKCVGKTQSGDTTPANNTGSVNESSGSNIGLYITIVIIAVLLIVMGISYRSRNRSSSTDTGTDTALVRNPFPTVSNPFPTVSNPFPTLANKFSKIPQTFAGFFTRKQPSDNNGNPEVAREITSQIISSARGSVPQQVIDYPTVSTPAGPPAGLAPPLLSVTPAPPPLPRPPLPLPRPPPALRKSKTKTSSSSDRTALLDQIRSGNPRLKPGLKSPDTVVKRTSPIPGPTLMDQISATLTSREGLMNSSSDSDFN